MSWEEAFAEDMEARGAKKRTVTVGWAVRAPHAHIIWGPPKPFEHNLPKATSAKSVQACPAAIDFDRRHFVIPCPLDLTLKFQRQPNGQVTLVDADGEQSAVRPQGMRELLTELAPELEEHIKTIADVTNFVNRSFSLFAEAQRRRPATLLKPKKS